MFAWMAWTQPVAVFFAVIGLVLVGMTAWEIRSPTVERRGFLPMKTTRGDRLFIGLLAVAWINLFFIGLAGRLAAWLHLAAEPTVGLSFVLSLAVLAFIMRRG